MEIEFEPAVASYVRARRLAPVPDAARAAGRGDRVTLDVCLDQALRSWILSFGPFARVVAPAALAREIAQQFEQARRAVSLMRSLQRPSDSQVESF